MYDLSIFTREERENCVPLVEKIGALVDFARIEGIFGLEKVVQAESDGLLAFALQLIVDATDPETVRMVLQTLINAEGMTGETLLRSILITEGVLAIQNGEQPKNIERKLLSHLGLEFLRARGHLPMTIGA